MLANMVRETTTNPGTSTTISLNGAATGFQGFLSAFASGTVVYWFLDDGSQWECGYGAVTSGSPNTLARTTVLANSAGTTARLNFTGSTRVYGHVPAERAVYLGTAGAVLGASAFGMGQPLWGGTAGGTANARTVTLAPVPAAYGAGMAIRFINGAAANAAGALTLNANSLGARTILLPDAATAPLAGMLPASTLIEVVDDGTRFLLTQPDYSSGLVKLHSATFSGASQVDIVTLFAGYKEFHFSGHIWTSVDAATIRWRTSVDTGSSFSAGASDYVYQAAGTSAATTLVAANNTADHVNVGAGDAGASSSGLQISGVIFPGDGTRNPRISAITGGAFDNGGGAFVGAVHIAGERVASARIDAMRFIPTSGTISGHLTVRGVI